MTRPVWFASLAALIWVSAGLPAAPLFGQCVLIETERFQNYGGWVDDSQFMDRMGSPFLLAHGLGTPVADASTTVEFSATGSYRVWVRTRDWVAPWNAAGAPGRFQLVVNGKTLETGSWTAFEREYYAEVYSLPGWPVALTS